MSGWKIVKSQGGKWNTNYNVSSFFLKKDWILLVLVKRSEPGYRPSARHVYALSKRSHSNWVPKYYSA